MRQDIFTFCLQACFKHRITIQFVGAVVGSSLTLSCLLVRRTVRYAPVRTAKDKVHLCSVLYSKTCHPYSRDGWIRPLQWFVVMFY